MKILTNASRIAEKSPSEFLAFITDVLALICDEKDNSVVKSANYTLIRTITEIVQPWLRKDSESVADIAAGLNGLCELTGTEGFKEAIGVTMSAIGTEMVETSLSYELIEKYMTGINMLLLILKGVEEAWLLRMEERKAA